MDNEKLKKAIFSLVPDAQLEENAQFLTCTIPPASFKTLAMQLKNNQDLAFDYLFNLTGVDFGTELGVVYHLNSTLHDHDVVLKVKTTDRENPTFDTVSDLWRAADFYEREIWDLFGIRFTGHTDLRRIFLDEEWVGYPLRKDYRDDVNIIEL